MYRVRTASTEDLAGVIGLVARLQRDPAHHVGFFGESREEVAEELSAVFSTGAVVAVDQGGRLRGALCVERSAERSYLYGPFVDVPANHPAAGQVWRTTADALLEAAAVTGPLELFGHRENRLLADFARRHDVPVYQETGLFVLEKPPLRDLLAKEIVDDRVIPLPADPGVRAEVARLHDLCFPGASTPGAQLVAGRHTVVVLLGNGLLGYAAGFAQAAEYYVDSVGVDPDARSCGVGRTVVRRLLVELARVDARERAAAVVRSGNHASEHMFAKLGFERTADLICYRAG
jgi:ribosomal protein S18 acetylase RimI-like enzyme